MINLEGTFDSKSHFKSNSNKINLDETKDFTFEESHISEILEVFSNDYKHSHPIEIKH